MIYTGRPSSPPAASETASVHHRRMCRGAAAGIGLDPQTDKVSGRSPSPGPRGEGGRARQAAAAACSCSRILARAYVSLLSSAGGRGPFGMNDFSKKNKKEYIT
jgi:hypothetical protein